ncbi:MAG: hypothetical protein RL653_3213 [Pseudomonadota bacterium]|jgi:hypothetical protein
MVSSEHALSPSLRMFRYELERARELLEGGEWAEAHAALLSLRERARAEGLESAQLLHGLGVAAAGCGDFAAGVQHLLAAVCMDPLCEGFRASLDRVLLRIRLALLEPACTEAPALYALLEQAHAADDQAHTALMRHLLRAGRTEEVRAHLAAARTFGVGGSGAGRTALA